MKTVQEVYKQVYGEKGTNETGGINCYVITGVVPGYVRVWENETRINKEKGIVKYWKIVRYL